MKTMTHLLLLMLIKTILSQPPPPPICVWGNSANNTYTAMNGLYIAEPILTTYNSKPYYVKSAGSNCTTLYMYWTLFNDWGISSALGGTDIAWCNSSSTPRTCNTWYTLDHYIYAYAIDSDVQIFAHSCPSLNCDAITIPNAPNGCDTFDVALGENIWKNSITNRWWYFEPYYFAWHCTQYEPTCTNYYVAWTTMGWSDISKGENMPIQLEYPNSNTYTLNCLQNGPTKSPTHNPTNNPITFAPTHVPTQNPSTTNAPTNIATSSTANVYNSASTAAPNSASTTAPDEGSVHVANSNATFMTTVAGAVAVDGANPFWTVFIIFLVLILICIICLCVAFRYKFKKDKSAEEVKHIHVYSVDVNAMQCRDRVLTESKYIDDEKEDIDVADNCNVDGPRTPDHDESVAAVAQTVEMFHMQTNDGGLVDDATANTQTVNGEGMGGSPGQCEGDETIIQKHAVKEWLEQKVKLPQYYDVFMDNGYDSLDIIAVITDDTQLTEIGILLKGHKLKIMTEIKILKEMIMNVYND